MYGAFYASTVGACEYDSSLPYTDSISAVVQLYKERIVWVAQDLVRNEAELGEARLPLLWQRLSLMAPVGGWETETDIYRVRDGLLSRHDAVAATNVNSTAPYAHWGRAEDLQAAAIHLREPVYDVGVLADGSVLAQCHACRDEQGPDSDTNEVGREIPISISQLAELVTLCAANDAMPTILVLRHSDAGNHVQGLRFSDCLYDKIFLADDSVRGGSQARLHAVQVELGLETTSAVLEYDFDFPDNEVEEETRLAAWDPGQALVTAQVGGGGGNDHPHTSAGEAAGCARGGRRARACTESKMSASTVGYCRLPTSTELVPPRTGGNCSLSATPTHERTWSGGIGAPGPGTVSRRPHRRGWRLSRLAPSRTTDCFRTPFTHCLTLNWRPSTSASSDCLSGAIIGQQPPSVNT